MALKDILKRNNDEDRNYTIVIYGEPGVGKTALASTFDKPAFIKLEPGLRDNKILTTDILESYDEVVSAINDFIKDEHTRKTLVVDSLSKLDLLIIDSVIREAPEYKGQQTPPYGDLYGGYHKANQKVSEKHKYISNLLEKLKKERGMDIVLLCHSKNKEMPHPLFMGNFLKTCLDLKVEMSEDWWVRFPDVIARLSVPMDYEEEKKGGSARIKATNKKQRILDCVANVYQHSKNNIGISEVFYYKEGENPLLQFINKKEKIISTEEKTNE